MAQPRQFFLDAINNSNFFCYYKWIWTQVLDEYGTLNILDIIGVRNQLADFNYDLMAAMNNGIFLNRVDMGLQQQIRLLTNHPEANNVGARRDLINWMNHIRIRLRDDQDWRRRYVAAIQQHGLFDAFIANFPEPEPITLPDVSMRDAIRQQERKPKPIRPPELHPEADCCDHCGKEHKTAECPVAGTVRRTDRGQMVALGDRPRCFVCATRNRKKSDTQFHNSENCRLRNPLSRVGVNRRCPRCRRWLGRCWNCAVPACVNKHCRGFGHNLSRCPNPRLPIRITETHGPGAEQRLSLQQRLAALGIQRVPRELRFLPNVTRNEEEEANRGQGESDAEYETASEAAEVDVDILEDIVQAVERDVDIQPEQEICTICLDDLNLRKFITTSCGHRFHADCYIEHCRRSVPNYRPTFCPLCRSTNPSIAETHIPENGMIVGAPAQPQAGPSTSRLPFNRFARSSNVQQQDDSDNPDNPWRETIPSHPSFHERPEDIALFQDIPAGNMANLRLDDFADWGHPLPTTLEQIGVLPLQTVGSTAPIGVEQLRDRLIQVNDDLQGAFFGRTEFEHLDQLANVVGAYGLPLDEDFPQLVASILYQATQSRHLELFNALFPIILPALVNERGLHTVWLEFERASPTGFDLFESRRAMSPFILAVRRFFQQGPENGLTFLQLVRAEMERERTEQQHRGRGGFGQGIRR